MTEIAKKSGVSLKTVSRVMNEPDKVSGETLEKVKRAMGEQGYEVNLLAKALKGKRTNIVVVFLDLHNGEYLNAWRNEMLRYLFKYAGEIGIKLVVSPSDSQKFKDDHTDGFYLIGNGIADGAILLEYVQNDKRVEYLQKKNVPLVILGQPKETEIHAVSLDNFDVGYQSARYAAQTRYEKVVLFTGKKEHHSPKLRADGFLKGMQEMNRAGEVYYDITNAEETYQRVKELIEKGKSDCFIVPGDDRVLGVYRAIYELNKKIPEDIGVFAMDDLPANQFLYPPLAALHHDFKGIARECIALLESQLGQEDEKKKKQIFFPSEIIERESIKKKEFE